jgi:putative ABC transport system substrate-binding protein
VAKDRTRRASTAEVALLVAELDQAEAYILAAGYEAIRAAKIATGTIPIVMVVAGDPVGSGFVTSLARPGGNITGNSIINPTLPPKRLEVLKQVLPTLSRVPTLLNKRNPLHQVEWKATLAAAKALAIVVQPCEVRGPMDFEPAFAAMIGARRSGGRTRRRSIRH